MQHRAKPDTSLDGAIHQDHVCLRHSVRLPSFQGRCFPELEVDVDINVAQ